MVKFKSVDIVKRLGITKVQLNHWLNMGVIKPHIDDKRRGGVRYFSKQNLIEFYICKHLNGYGLPVHKMLTVLTMIREAKLIDGKNFYEAIAANPKLKQHYAIISPIISIDDDGNFSEVNIKDIEAVTNLPDSVKPMLAEMVGFAGEQVGAVVTTPNNFPKFLSKHPTAIVINLNAYVKTVGGL
jgi:DNA-binding transcriptional MerR regulator